MEFYIKKDTPRHLFHQHWRFCVGSGHAPLAVRSDYSKMLSFIRQELGIQYVRFHGIFSGEMEVLNHFGQVFPIKGAENFQEINFRKIGAVYDQILECGMKPFIELSFMPEILAKEDRKCFFYYKDNIAPPKDYKKWAEFIRTFLRFLISRYGKEEVETWYFEVWNEPDLKGFFSGNKEEYFKLYEVTARTIKEEDADLRVGGPATSGSKWVHGFMEYCESHDAPVDFISTHQYAGDPVGMIDVEGLKEEDETKLDVSGMFSFDLRQVLSEGNMLDALRCLMPDKSETEELPNYGFRDNAAIVKQQAKGLPVFYTEWNENAIFSAYTNDTRKVAAYDVKAILDTEKTVDASSIWCFSDLFEEFHHFPQEFHGGFGMLTSSGIPKPLFYALKMLTMVSSERLELGEGSTDGEIGIAAFAEEGKRQVLLFRQKMKNLDLPKELARITIECPFEVKVIKQYRIDEEHCNPLKYWERMGKPDIPTPKQVDQIKENTKMRAEDVCWEQDGERVEFQVELGVNDVYLLALES